MCVTGFKFSYTELGSPLDGGNVLTKSSRPVFSRLEKLMTWRGGNREIRFYKIKKIFSRVQ